MAGAPVAIAFLRAVNVAGHGRLAMTDLARAVTSLGGTDAVTVLQTGNAVFRLPAGTAPDAFAAALADRLAADPGVATEVIVRLGKDWSATLAANPFPAVAAETPRKLVVMPLRNTPDAARVAALAAAIAGREEVAAVGTTLFAVYPDGVGRSKLTTALIEKTLGTRGTGRNFDTARKIETAALTLSAA
ncbi:DUF1697 domain-containing protein [Acuticoccus sp. I52.16.1]|uniref:DUF1697 domain-containing protein n=1 Tax=Acuticoccus sp. I52.16.1 TaxID=2928472 RepID=UPI001FD3E0B7|nr:DUF1697 domain-containing protein [Acuticoccus sp. I52.16.1]UOM33593.1 DUF1697 domain-containing protein [Acuticoccus sp. I52.16.1]